MPVINVRICESCMKQLLVRNPYVDEHGRPVSFKGIQLNRISSQYCEHKVKGTCQTAQIKLVPVRCGNCSKTYWLVDRPGKMVCPSSTS